MLSRSPGEARENTTRVLVDVTFLRMSRLPLRREPQLPASDRIERVVAPTTAFYRYLYAAVGGSYCWWLRRVTPDAELAALLADPAVSLHVLYRGGEPAGFFELDARDGRDVNIAYFGLLPHLVGKGIGGAFLRAAIDAAWALNPAGVRVNTCSADHPRALDTYRRAGFVALRTVRETWDIPNALGLDIPSRLRQ